MTDRKTLLDWLASEFGIRWVEITSESPGFWLKWESELYNGLEKAPFTSRLGVIRDTKTIVGVPSTPWPAILHEAGHLVAANPTKKLCESDEASWFGWEIATLRHLGLDKTDFLHNNRDYGIEWPGPSGTREDLGHLLEDEVEVFFDEKVREAQQLGVVSREGRPLPHP